MYTLIIRNIKQAKVFRLIDAISETAPDAEIIIDGLADGAVKMTPKKANGRITGERVLSLTGKKAREDSRLYVVHTALEKLEAKHGVGHVTRDDLYNALVDKTEDPGGDISRALSNGYISA